MEQGAQETVFDTLSVSSAFSHEQSSVGMKLKKKEGSGDRDYSSRSYSHDGRRMVSSPFTKNKSVLRLGKLANCWNHWFVQLRTKENL